MNAPSQHTAPDLTQFREFIGEAMSMAAIQADLAVTYAQISDDTGLEYATRSLVAYTRAAAGALKDLKSVKAQKEIAA